MPVFLLPAQKMHRGNMCLSQTQPMLDQPQILPLFCIAIPSAWYILIYVLLQLMVPQAGMGSGLGQL